MGIASETGKKFGVRSEPVRRNDEGVTTFIDARSSQEVPGQRLSISIAEAVPQAPRG